MKFLCIPCDEPMQLRSAKGPDRGSMSLVYACPTCGYGVAMLTNPHETQVVRSLGVELGPGGEERAAASRCPVTGMLRELEAGRDSAAGAPAGASPAAAETEASLPWSGEAAARLAAIPELFRPMAKSGIERYAREHGHDQVTEEVLDQARTHFGL